MSGELNNDPSPLVVDSDKGFCCQRSFSESTSVILNLFAERNQIQTYMIVLLESLSKIF